MFLGPRRKHILKFQHQASTHKETGEKVTQNMNIVGEMFVSSVLEKRKEYNTSKALLVIFQIRRYTNRSSCSTWAIANAASELNEFPNHHQQSINVTNRSPTYHRHIQKQLPRTSPKHDQRIANVKASIASAAPLPSSLPSAHQR